jgi:hypothetical protein
MILTSDKQIEVYKVLTQEELTKKLKRKLKRQTEKKSLQVEGEMELEPSPPTLEDRFLYSLSFTFPKKTSSFILMPLQKFAISFLNNNLEIYKYVNND